MKWFRGIIMVGSGDWGAVERLDESAPALTWHVAIDAGGRQ